MTRRMSCSMTVEAVKLGIKTVTRRHVDTWRDLKPGDRLTLIEKGMGLPKGAKQVVLRDVEITDVRVEPLDRVCADGEVEAEGFPGMHPVDFMVMWAKSHKSPHGTAVNCRRIEWKYL